MSATVASPLEQTIRQAGEGWLLDDFTPRSEALDHLRRVLEDVHRRAQERLGAGAPDLREAALVEEFRRHPSQVRGFFQALAGTRTPDMLLMVWRIIQGMEIKNVQLSYQRKRLFRVQVILESPYGEEDAPYESDRIQDFALFRHVGIMEMDNAPILDGFYPLRVRGK
jgi:hypothetical protein